MVESQRPVLVVERVGAQVTIQDLGRPGFGNVGVPTGGAMDRTALKMANRLVGNDVHAAGLEVLLAGAEFVARADAVLAVTGAPTAVERDHRPAPFAAPFLLHEGQRLRISPVEHGLWTYVAIRGGVNSPRVLGSAASSPVLQVGPPPLRSGDRILRAEQHVGEPVFAELDQHRWGATREVGVLVGPRDDWFTRDALTTLTRTTWQVSTDVNRVGARLNGPVLQRSCSTELPSEGMVRGAVQVSTSGQPTVFLADHPTTGGYPVIAVVTDADVDLVAQCRPGDTLRFHRLPAPF